MKEFVPTAAFLIPRKTEKRIPILNIGKVQTEDTIYLFLRVKEDKLYNERVALRPYSFVKEALCSFVKLTEDGRRFLASISYEVKRDKLFTIGLVNHCNNFVSLSFIKDTKKSPGLHDVFIEICYSDLNPFVSFVFE